MIEGYRVRSDLGGVIEQIDKSNRITYDSKYVEDRYETYKEQCDRMGYLRIGWILGSKANNYGKRILEIGYGNGAFLNVAKHYYEDTIGFDINGFDISHIEGVTTIEEIPFSERFDTVCFYDSLEHFDDPTIIKNLNTKYIVITIPHLNFLGTDKFDEYFKTWKHRRENEHFWHWNRITLINFMLKMGYDPVATSYIEDSIRTPIDDLPNTFTATFKKTY